MHISFGTFSMIGVAHLLGLVVLAKSRSRALGQLLELRHAVVMAT